MHRHAGALAGGEQARHVRGRPPVVHVNATHVVVRARPDRDGLLDRVGAGEGDGQLADLRQPLHDAVAAQVAQVEQHAAVDPAALHDLRGLGAGHHVTGCQLELVGGVLAHEALPVLVQEVAALSAGTFRHEHAVRGERGGVELHELHVLERHALAEGQAHGVAGRSVRVRRRAVDAPGAASGHHHGLGADRLDAPVDHVVGHDPHGVAGVVGHQVGDEPLLVGRDVVLHAHGVERVQDDQPGQVGRVAGAREPGAAEGALGDLAGVLLAAEDRSPVLQLVHLQRRALAEDLDRVLVADVVGALDGVERVVLGAVLGLVAEGGVDPALGRARMAADRVELGHEGDVNARLVRGDGRPHARKTGTDDDDVVCAHCSDTSG